MRFILGFKYAVTLLCVLTLSSASIAAAKSECKGLDKQTCEDKGTCSWVKSYTTKKGTQVNAFCRKKPVRKQTSEKAGTPKGT